MEKSLGIRKIINYRGNAKFDINDNVNGLYTSILLQGISGRWSVWNYSCLLLPQAAATQVYRSPILMPLALSTHCRIGTACSPNSQS